MSLLFAHPIPTLLQRIHAELSATFAPGAIRIGRSPASLDVMGGIAAETGSISATIPLDRIAATAAAQPRSDGLLQIFSFDEFDAHRPFTLCMPMAALINASTESLRASLAEPGRRWAWSVIGAARELLLAELLDGQIGLSVALLNNSSPHLSEASLAAATINALLCSEIDEITQAELTRAVGQSMLGDADPLTQAIPATRAVGGVIGRWQSDTQQLLSPLPVPTGMRFVAIDTNAQRDKGEHAITTTRIATAMAHALILKKMRDMGTAAGRTLLADPMGGFLARLDSNDYKRWFRPYLPATLRGDEFLKIIGETAAVVDQIVTSRAIDPDQEYPVRGMADHHVLEALRVRNFCRFIEQGNQLQPGDPKRGVLLDKAGHLMYASHQSLSSDATLGIEQADLLVRLIRQRERHGLYGARLTGDGGGDGRSGLVAVLCEDNDRATTGLADVLMNYSEQTTLAAASYRTSSEAIIVAGGAEALVPSPGNPGEG